MLLLNWCHSSWYRGSGPLRSMWSTPEHTAHQAGPPQPSRAHTNQTNAVAVHLQPNSTASQSSSRRKRLAAGRNNGHITVVLRTRYESNPLKLPCHAPLRHPSSPLPDTRRPLHPLALRLPCARRLSSSSRAGTRKHRAAPAPMETPLSNRRITRSLAAAAALSAQKSAADFTRPKNAGAGDRTALHDITNDSPIVGLAAGCLHDKTPADSTATKTRPRPRRTPGSGEALLRGQVKALLHKVHEEQGAAAAAVLARPPARIQALLGVTRSPAQLLAPTPANTPQIGDVAREGLLLPDGSTVMPCVLEEEESLIPKLQVIEASLPPSPIEENFSEGQLHRALVFDDSPGKSDLSNASVVSSSLKFPDSSSGSSHMDKPSSSTEDDSSSVWSIQVHASPEKGEELGEDLGEYTEEEEDWEEGSDDDDDCFDDLCEGTSKMTVFDEEEEKAGLPQFEGKHTRFIYNSDDEIEKEEVVPSAEARAELGALMLRGLPVPKGRHLRFHEDDEDED